MVHLVRDSRLNSILAGRKLLERKVYRDKSRYCREMEKEGLIEPLFETIEDCYNILSTYCVEKAVVEKYSGGITVTYLHTRDVLCTSDEVCVEIYVVDKKGKVLYEYDCEEYFSRKKWQTSRLRKKIGDEYLVIATRRDYNGGYIYVVTPHGMKLVYLNPLWLEIECDLDYYYEPEKCQPEVPKDLIWVDDLYASAYSMDYDDFIEEINEHINDPTLKMVNPNKLVKVAKKYGIPTEFIRKYRKLYMKHIEEQYV